MASGAVVSIPELTKEERAKIRLCELGRLRRMTAAQRGASYQQVWRGNNSARAFSLPDTKYGTLEAQEEIPEEQGVYVSMVSPRPLRFLV